MTDTTNMTNKSNMTKMKISIICIVILIISLMLSYAIASMSTNPQKKSKAEQIPTVDIQAVQISPYQVVVNTQSKVQSRQSTTLSSDISGKILWISDLFNEGKSLKKGFAIATIDPTTYESNLAQAKANLAQAELALAEENARGEQATEDWNNLQSSLENAGNNEADPLLLRIPQGVQAQAQVDAATAAVKKAQADLSQTRIRMPFDGIIDNRHISVGQFVGVGTQIADLLGKQKEVRLPLTSDQLLDIKKDTKVELKYNTLIEMATLLHVDANVDPNTQITYATAKLTPDSQIPVGAFITAKILGNTYENTLRLPNKAISMNDDKNPIFYTVHKDNQILAEHVATVIAQQNESWILDAEKLETINDQSIVITKLINAHSGMLVKIANGDLDE